MHGDPPASSIPRFDPMDPSFYGGDAYHDVLRRLRDAAPVHRVGDDVVTVARYHDIREVSRDPGRFRSGGGAMVHDPIREGTSREGPQSILFMDPPQHAAHRRLVSRKFTPRAVSGLEDRVRAMAATLFDDVPAREPIDVVDRLTASLPLLVIAELLGIDGSDRGDFRRWSDATIESTDRPQHETAEAIGELQAFLWTHIQAKRLDPGDDLVSALTLAQVEGRPLEIGELFAWVLTLLVAGNETTRTLLSGGIEVLAGHPDQRAHLVSDPSAIPNAVEEMLRWVTPIQTFCRTATQDTDVAGHPVREGDYLIMLYASGNRDETVFGDSAGSFDVGRDFSAPHLAFGFGEHLCLGAALARLEARVFFEELLRRYPSYAVVGEPDRVPSTLIAGIRSLPVVLEP